MNPVSSPSAVSNAGQRRAATRRFRLLRYYFLAALASFLMVGIAAYVFERKELRFFDTIQLGQSAFFNQVQAELSGKTEQAARDNLILAQETANVNMTVLLANVLWDSDIAHFLARVKWLSVDECRNIEERRNIPAEMAPAARKECFAELGRRIRSMPGFSNLDRRTLAAMKGSTVFKVKVYDMRGLTVYSSEHRQIGEDKSGNSGWRSAAAGKAASELTHRDQFSAFEGMVENRDLISSYIPVRRNGSDHVLGVFEIYSDVTPFLQRVQNGSQQLAAIVAANQQKVESTSRRNTDTVVANSVDLLRGVGGLLILLFVVLLLIVKRGQTIIDRQSLAQEQSAARARLWHKEKMAAMAAIAANVSHETGNALAIIAGLAGELSDPQPSGVEPHETMRLISTQSSRITHMSRQIDAFATIGGEEPVLTDINRLIEAVCYFYSFDRRFSKDPIEFRPGEPLSSCQLVPDHLKEALMNLLPEQRGHVIVETLAHQQGVVVRISSTASVAALAERKPVDLSEARLDLATRRIEDMGGSLKIADGSGMIEIMLPALRPVSL